MKTIRESVIDAAQAIKAFRKKNQEVYEDKDKRIVDEVTLNKLLNPLYTAKELLVYAIEITNDEYVYKEIDDIKSAIITIDHIIRKVKTDNIKNDDVYHDIDLIVSGLSFNLSYVGYMPTKTLYYESGDCNEYLELKKDMLRLLSKKSKRRLNVLFMPLDQSDKLSEEYFNIEKEAPEYKINKFAVYSDNEFNIQREIYDKVAVGKIESITSTNSAFDVIDLRFSLSAFYGSDPLFTEGITFGEKCLNKALLYVRDNGYIFININAAYISKNVMETLTSNGEIMAIFCTKKSLDYEKNTEYMILYKRKRFFRDITGRVFRKFRDEYNTNRCRLVDINASINIEELINESEIKDFNSSHAAEIRIFRGGQPDIHRLMGVLEKSNAFSSKEDIFTVEPKPLLPLTKGQVGQILVSGNLDGVIDEGNGYKHAIKGLVKKETITVSTEYQGVNDIPQYAGTSYLLMKQKKYTSNAVSLMILTSEGKCKEL